MDTWRSVVNEFENYYDARAEIVDIDIGKALVFNEKIVAYLIDTKKRGWAPVKSDTIFIDTSIDGVDIIRIFAERSTRPGKIFAFNDDIEKLKSWAIRRE